MDTKVTSHFMPALTMILIFIKFEEEMVMSMTKMAKRGSVRRVNSNVNHTLHDTVFPSACTCIRDDGYQGNLTPDISNKDYNDFDQIQRGNGDGYDKDGKSALVC
eukprot:1403794-Ditylum_brightwellii.AAC.1